MIENKNKDVYPIVKIMKMLNKFVETDKLLATNLIKIKLPCSTKFIEEYNIKVNKNRDCDYYYTTFIDILNLIFENSDYTLVPEISENGTVKKFILVSGE